MRRPDYERLDNAYGKASGVAMIYASYENIRSDVRRLEAALEGLMLWAGCAIEDAEASKKYKAAREALGL